MVVSGALPTFHSTFKLAHIFKSVLERIKSKTIKGGKKGVLFQVILSLVISGLFRSWRWLSDSSPFSMNLRVCEAPCIVAELPRGTRKR